MEIEVTKAQKRHIKQDCPGMSRHIEFENSKLIIPERVIDKFSNDLFPEAMINFLRSVYDINCGLDSVHTNTKKSMLRLAGQIEEKR